MNSQLHEVLYRVEAAGRNRDVPRAVIPVRRQHPPPRRGFAARLARRLDSKSAA
jgi:hypothetical protein